MIKAQVFRSAQRVFDCKILGDESKKVVQARATAKLLKDDAIVVGDFVHLSPLDDSGTSFQIEEVLKRTSEIYRVIVRENRKKITAANCDYLLIVTSVSKPHHKQGIVDRYLLRSEQWGIPAIVVFNKIDEYDPKDFDLQSQVVGLKALGVESYAVSAKFPELKQPPIKLGFFDLKAHLHNKTVIVLGQSGVGKSRLISGLTDGKIQLLSQEIGKANKGIHTTTWSEIIESEGLKLIDTPGIRSFSIDDILEDDLKDFMPDLTESFAQCRFPNCEHNPKALGCFFFSEAIQKNKDDPETALLLSRLESYQKFLEEIRSRPAWKKNF